MKAKMILVIGLILATAIWVGCSNNGRTTAPVDNGTLNLSNNANAGSTRFDADNSIPVVTGTIVEWDKLQGIFNMDLTGCISLQVGKDNFVELNFRNGIPGIIQNGALVLVVGNYVNSPSGHCQLAQRFSVRSVRVIKNPSVN
jgi:hypothetical protein